MRRAPSAFHSALALLAVATPLTRGAAAHAEPGFERPRHLWFVADPSMHGTVRLPSRDLGARLRLDLGPAIVDGPRFLAFGAAIDLSFPGTAAVSGFTQFLHAGNGLVAGAAVGVDFDRRFVASANVGITWFTLDVRLVSVRTPSCFVGLGLRIPVGGILHGAIVGRRPFTIPSPVDPDPEGDPGDPEPPPT